MEKLEYTRGQEDEYFARFRAKSLAAWPIDLMFVDDLTFDRMTADATQSKIGGVNVAVVSARHLVTLKIHALKHFQELRFAKDFGDVILLLRTGEAQFSTDELREVCARYANLDLFTKLQAELELP